MDHHRDYQLLHRRVVLRNLPGVHHIAVEQRVGVHILGDLRNLQHQQARQQPEERGYRRRGFGRSIGRGYRILIQLLRYDLHVGGSPVGEQRLVEDSTVPEIGVDKLELGEQ